MKIVGAVALVLSALALPQLAHAQRVPGGQPIQACFIARALISINGSKLSADNLSQIQQLATIACTQRTVPANNVLYPNGGFAFVASGFSDDGSWKYPNGGYAFVGGGFSDVGSWKYPDGGYAFVGGGFSDVGSWKYADGGYAFVGAGFSDVGSYKYIGGAYAFVGAGFSDHDSWRYPDGTYGYAGPGFSDAGSWYYPNHVLFEQGLPANTDGTQLVRIVEVYKNAFFNDFETRNVPAQLAVVLRLKWIQDTLQ
jgi:hypothetical protein